MTYINRNVTDHSMVVRQADIAGLVVRGADAPIGAVGGGRRSVGVDNECAFDIDLDTARADNSAVNLFGRGHCAGARVAPGI